MLNIYGIGRLGAVVRIHKTQIISGGGSRTGGKGHKVFRAQIYQTLIFLPPPWKNPVSAPDEMINWKNKNRKIMPIFLNEGGGLWCPTPQPNIIKNLVCSE